MYIKYYDSVGELGTVSLSGGKPTSLTLPNGEYFSVGSSYRPFLNYVQDGDIIYVKITQSGGFCIALGKYNIDEFDNRTITILYIISSYGTLSSSTNAEITTQNNNSLSDRVASNALFVKNISNFTPELLTSDYVVSLSGNMSILLPPANVDNANIKYGFYILKKEDGGNYLQINASGSNSIVNHDSSTGTQYVRVTGVGSYVEMIANSGGNWYQISSSDVSGGAGGSVAGSNKSIQYNNNSVQAGSQAFWDNSSKTLFLGSDNNVSNADVVISSSQNKASGIYPFLLKLNNGNFFALTKEGKVGINTPSLPLYESSPHFHVVGRCAVFEGICGAGGVALTLYNNPEVVPGSGSIAGTVNLSARNSNRNVVNFAQVQSKVLNPVKGQTQGQFLVNVDASGLPNNVLKLDNNNFQIGPNEVTSSRNINTFGKSNTIDHVNNGTVIGNSNSIDNSNNVFVLGSGNSIDFIKNSVRYILSESNISVLYGLEWMDLDNLIEGDIVQVTNNGALNGYYVASAAAWTKLTDDVAVTYLGTSNLLVGSDNILSGNNLIVFGNDCSLSGNNLSVFGNYNDVTTQSIQDIIIPDNLLFNTATVFGEYNSINASGLVVFGNKNSATGVYGLLLNGSNNAIGSGSINSIVIGNNNSITISSGINIGNNITGTFYSSSNFGINNTLNGSGTLLLGSNNNVSGTGHFVVGSQNSINGFRNNVHGYNNSILSSSGNFLGNSQATSGLNNILIGNTISLSGNNNTIIGNGTINSGLISDTTIISNNFVHSGTLSSSLVLTNNLVLGTGNYKDLNVIGSNNTVSSGIDNILVLGDNNNLKNVFNFNLPVYAFVSNVDGTQFTKASSSSSELALYAKNDIIDLSFNTQTASGIIDLVYLDADTQVLTIEPTAPITGFTSANIRSRTTYDKLIVDGSKPISILGNKNTVIGISGIVVGNTNYASGNELYLYGHNNFVNGNHVISIGNSISVSGVEKAVAIGSNNNGSLSGTVVLGFDNSLHGSSSHNLGSLNTSAHENTIVGSSNTLGTNNTSVVGSNNLVSYKSQNEKQYKPAEVYDDFERFIFRGLNSNTNLINTGSYNVENQTFDCSLGKLSHKQKDKAIIQFVYNKRYLPAYVGYITSAPDTNNESASIAFNSNIPFPTVNDPTLNDITLSEFVQSLFPGNTPTDLTGYICVIGQDNDAVVVGNNNVVVSSENLSLLGSNNQFNIDTKITKSIPSGIIIGNNNQVFNSLRHSTSNGVVYVDPIYPNATPLFQGAIGLNLYNTDPNSIKFGFDRNSIKIFDLSGKADSITTSVVDPNVSPPETISYYAEKIGVSGSAYRGVVVNSDYVDNSFFVMNNSSSKSSVISVISAGSGYVGINKDKPEYSLDVNGIARSNQVLSKRVVSDNIVMTSGAKAGYFLSSISDAGDMEWVGGVKVDVSGIPGTLLYFSGIVGSGGKVQPISTLVNQTTLTGPQDFLLNTVTYEPSGSTITQSGLIFNKYNSVDKYAVMTLDEHRRTVLGYPIADVEKMPEANPGGIGYVSRLIKYAQGTNHTNTAHYIPRQYNALYFIPESAQYFGATYTGSDPYVLNMQRAGQAQESVFAIGRRNSEFSKPIDLDKGEDVDTTNTLFPGGLSTPQTIISTIPKKDQFGSAWAPPRYKFGAKELFSPHLAPYAGNSLPASDLFNNIRPMQGSTFNGTEYLSWWYYDTAKNEGSRPVSDHSTQKRSVPTAFNLGLQEIDFVIYGTGTKYSNGSGKKELPSKFIFGSSQDYIDWEATGLGNDKSDFPFLTKIPAFYFNSSINSFMIHTDRPSWIPYKLPANECEPCNPVQSGIQFADLTVRGWIASSGVRIGQGFRRAFSVDADGNLTPAVNSQGAPVYESTEGMMLTSDKFGFAVWQPLGGVSTTNTTLTNNTVTTSSETLTEGVLDPVTKFTTEFAYETSNTSDTARLYRDTINVRDENLLSNTALRLRGVTRNSLLFAKNPRPNSLDNYSGDFNESSVPASSNDMNIDGTENLFYYGYTNAIEGVFSYNTSSNTTEVVIDGDATRRVQVGDVVRILYKYMDINVATNTEVEVSSIVRASVIGVNSQSSEAVVLSATDVGGPRTFYTRTSVVLDKKIDHLTNETYNLDRNSTLRRAALISETVGGYLTFNFPGSSPDIVLSNRPGIDSAFNANGKNIGFTVYGKSKSELDMPPAVMHVDRVTNGLLINTEKAIPYGNITRVVENIQPEDERNINSALYYDYGWNEEYILGEIKEYNRQTTVAFTSSQTNLVKTGDIIELLYDTYQTIKMYVSSISSSGNNYTMSLSLNKIGFGLIEDEIGNLMKDTNGNIVSRAVKFKIVKRQIAKKTIATTLPNGDAVTSVIASGLVPAYASASVKGLLQTDSLMIEQLGGMTNPSGTHPLVFSKFGLLSKSSLAFFDYTDIADDSESSHLVYKTNLPSLIDTKSYTENNVAKKAPVLADVTLGGKVKVNNLYVDQINNFGIIDCGTVVFRGKCDQLNLICEEPTNS